MHANNAAMNTRISRRNDHAQSRCLLLQKPTNAATAELSALCQLRKQKDSLGAVSPKFDQMF